MGVLKVIAVDRIEGETCKVRVTFSEAVDPTTATNPANYVFSPAVTIVAAAIVSGSGSTQVDLQLGVELANDANTIAEWRFNEPAWGNGTTWNATAITSSGVSLTCTCAGHTLVVGQLVRLLADVWDTDVPTPHLIATAGVGMVEFVVAGVSFNVRGLANGHASGNPGIGSFVEHWYLDETANNYDLMPRGNSGTGQIGDLNVLYPSLHGTETTGGIWLPGQNRSRCVTNATLGPRATMLGEWTVDGLVKWTSGGVDATEYIAAYGGLVDNTQDDNLLMGVGVTNAGRLYVAWEYGATGTVASFTGPTDILIPENNWCLFTATKTDLGGGLAQVRFYINGDLRVSSGPLTNCDGGDGPAMKLSGGMWYGHETSSYVFKGFIDTIRISNVVRSSADIKAYAQTALWGLLQSNPNQLQVSNVEDSATGTPIIAGNGFAGVAIAPGGNYTAIDVASCYSNKVITGRLGSDVLPAVPPEVVSVTPSNNQLAILFSEPVVLACDAAVNSNWILNFGSHYPQVTNISNVGSTVTLTTQEFKNGATYTLTIPSGITSVASGLALIAPFTHNFAGVGVAPTLYSVQSVSNTEVNVVFDEPVNESDALTAVNYSIDGGLSVLSVQKITSTIYRLRTSPQLAGVTYNITINNIKDLAGNLI